MKYIILKHGLSVHLYADNIQIYVDLFSQIKQWNFKNKLNAVFVKLNFRF